MNFKKKKLMSSLKEKSTLRRNSVAVLLVKFF